MTARILSGIEARDARVVRLQKRMADLPHAPELAIIQVGDRADSNAYIQAKVRLAGKIGVAVRHIRLEESSSDDVAVKAVIDCNKDPRVKGIIVQLPLPEGFDRGRIIEAIDLRKDVDGLTSANVALLEQGDPKAIVPATARGALELLEHYDIPVQGKNVTVVGRSALVGRPIAALLERKGAKVSVAHSKTIDLIRETKRADIVIVAVGKPGLITRDHVKEGQVIIDVGINEASETGQRRLVGDVDFAAVKDALGPSGAISPVPGGVGPMTVLGLFENLADAALGQAAIVW